MENASKALIIAGSILVAIMIVSLGILIFKNMSSSAKEAANMDEQEIANFNSKLTPYVGQNINGSQVNALIQLVVSIDNNAVHSGNTTKGVKIKYPSLEGDNQIYIDDAGAVQGLSKSKRVKTGTGIFYNVNAQYGTNGLINDITVALDTATP